VIDTAAFDGSILVVATANELITYDPNLTELNRAPKRTRCTSSVLVSGPRFICGSNEENFYITFNALTGAFVGGTAQNEIGPMRRVPGRDAFVTVYPDASPTRFFLFSVDAAGEVLMTANSPAENQETFRISTTYAFRENPAPHLINDQGLLVCLTPEDCADPTSGLRPDGDIGLLSDNDYFAAMDVDAAGKLHVLHGFGDAAHDSPACIAGCSVERIDAFSGAVEESVPFDFEKASFDLTVRADPQGGVVLGCHQSELANFGYRVVLLPDAP
jgi:hypothetical protein